MQGLDLAFWLEVERYKIALPDSKKYSVINLDSPEKAELQDRLYTEHSNPIIYRNNPNFVHVCNSDLGKNNRVFVAERWEEYLKLYCNASYVATNRVHTFMEQHLINIFNHVGKNTNSNTSA